MSRCARVALGSMLVLAVLAGDVEGQGPASPSASPAAPLAPRPGRPTLDPARELVRFVAPRRAALERFLAEWRRVPYQARQLVELEARARAVTGRADQDGLLLYLLASLEALIEQRELAQGRKLTVEERAEVHNEIQLALLDLIDRGIARGSPLLSRSGPLSATGVPPMPARERARLEGHVRALR